MLKLIAEADKHDRFRMYTPVTKGGAPIYVHAKVTIVDDRLLRVGSSNFNNRSMGFDTECDLVIEALTGRPGVRAVREQIIHVRNDLVGEHLGKTAEDVATAVRLCGTLGAAIESLRRNWRTLKPYIPPKPSAVSEALSESDLLDPEQPPSLTRRTMRRLMLQGSLR